MILSLFSHVADNRPRTLEVPWYEFIRQLFYRDEIHTRASRKEDVPCWSPASYREGATRANRTVLDISCLVLDYDELVDEDAVDQIRTRWTAWAHILHSTWSHTPSRPRMRVILPLASPIPGGVWSSTWTSYVADVDGIDRSCSDAARLYLVPAVRNDLARRTYQVEVIDGPRLELPVVRPAPRPPPPPIIRRGESPRRAAARCDPRTRELMGLALGGHLISGPSGERIEDVLCPGCGRRSVYWYLRPRGTSHALCEHRQTCGWHGWIDELGA